MSLQERGEGDLKYRDREKGQVKMEAKIGLRQLQVKEGQGLPATAEAKRDAWDRVSSESPEGINPANNLNVDF